jgi:hypothetical protein
MDVFKTLILDTPTAEGATGTVTSVDLTAGTGISVSGGPITSSGSITVTNTSPDQTVSIASGTGISVTGSYPSFTVTNSSPSLGGDVVGPADSLVADTADINGGTIDGTTVGATTPSTGAFTTLSATGAITGTAVEAFIANTGASANSKFIDLANTAGVAQVGVLSTGQAFLFGSQDTLIYGDGAVVGTLSSTGLAVTGDISTSGSGNREISINTTSNASSYLKYNVWGMDRAYIRAEAANPGAGSGTGSGKFDRGGNSSTKHWHTANFVWFNSTGSTTSKAFIGFDQTDKVVGLGITNSSTTRTGYFLYFFNDTGGSNGYINQVNNTTVAYTTTSDVRLKNNIRDFQNSGSIIDAIKPRTFDWNWGGKDATGFIAQELNEVFPEAVSAGDVGDEIDKTWGVDPAKLVPVLVAEIQSLRRRLAALESK